MNVIFTNPSFNPIEGANFKDAYQNIFRFVEDLSLPDTVELKYKLDNGSDDGRYQFILYYHENECEIMMPGAPLEKVRYMFEKPQNIWDYHRLYVNGNSWIWVFALQVVRDALFKEKEWTLREIVEQLQSCDYSCAAGPLDNNVAFIALKRIASKSNV